MRSSRKGAKQDAPSDVFICNRKTSATWWSGSCGHLTLIITRAGSKAYAHGVSKPASIPPYDVPKSQKVRGTHPPVTDTDWWPSQTNLRFRTHAVSRTALLAHPGTVATNHEDEPVRFFRISLQINVPVLSWHMQLCLPVSHNALGGKLLGPIPPKRSVPVDTMASICAN